jgi:hypothetical protein
LIAAAALMSMVVLPALLGRPDWWLNNETWMPLQAARFVAYGAYPFLYSAQGGWIAGPLLPVLLAPLAAAQDRFGLTDNFQFRVIHPTLWPFLMSFGIALILPLLLGIRRLLVSVRPSAARGAAARAQLAAALLVGVPVGIAFSHYEDLLALGCLVGAVLSWRGRRPVAAGVLMGLAICSKQWSLLALPTLVMATEPAERRRFVMPALLLTAFAYGIPLAFNPSGAGPALFAGRVFPTLGHPALWFPTTGVAVATPYRSLLLLAAFAPLPWVRRRHGTTEVIAALTVVFGARLFLEPVLFAYYPAGFLLFAALHAELTERSPLRTTVLGLASIALFAWHGDLPAWWAVQTALWVAVALPAFATLRRAGSASRIANRNAAPAGAPYRQVARAAHGSPPPPT